MWKKLRSSQKGKNPNPPSQARSPKAPAIAKTASNVAWDIHSEPPNGQDFSVPDLMSRVMPVNSQLQDIYQDLKRERNVLEQKEATFERTIQEESQTQKAEWKIPEDQYRSEIRRLKITQERLRQDFGVSDLISRLINANSQLQHISQDLERERNVLEQEIITFERTAQASQNESQIQKTEWRNREDQHRNEISRLEDAQGWLRQDCDENIWKIKLQYANRERALGATYKEQERQTRDEHESAMQELENLIKSLQTHAEKRENGFNLEKKQLEEAHRAKQGELEEAHRAKQGELEEAHRAKQDELEEAHRAKQDELEEHFKTYESRLKQAHKQQQERLQKDIQSRNKALIARENYSPITDGELKSMFSGLVREVDALARLKWTSNRSPWPNELLSRISDTTIRLQKQILKDTIWGILFEHVFCSPFRVFGEEGSVLESQWTEVFGKDPKRGNDHYTWPEPSFDAEQWRYETMKPSQEALKIHTSEIDPRTKLRKGFQSSMKIICEKLGGMLRMVSEIDKKTEQTMEEIAERAAKMCVAFGTQRCRIFVVIKDLKTAEEVKEGLDRQNKHVELLTQPELRRIGDADGQSLDKEQTVAGCEGEIKKFLY